MVVGLLQAATPLAFWWLDSTTAYALGLVVIAAVYVGFAVADGRPKVIAVESTQCARGEMPRSCSAAVISVVRIQLARESSQQRSPIGGCAGSTGVIVISV